MKTEYSAKERKAEYSPLDNISARIIRIFFPRNEKLHVLSFLRDIYYVAGYTSLVHELHPFQPSSPTPAPMLLRCSHARAMPREERRGGEKEEGREEGTRSKALKEH